MQASWIILSPLFTLVKTSPYLTKTSKSKRSLLGASE